MTQDEFKKGIAYFASTFRCGNIERPTLDVWFVGLQDVESEDFGNAIKKICQNVPKFYSGDNFVAMVREYANSAKKLRQTRQNSIALKDRKRLPMPNEFRKVLGSLFKPSTKEG